MSARESRSVSQRAVWEEEKKGGRCERRRRRRGRERKERESGARVEGEREEGERGDLGGDSRGFARGLLLAQHLPHARPTRSVFCQHAVRAVRIQRGEAGLAAQSQQVAIWSERCTACRTGGAGMRGGRSYLTAAFEDGGVWY
eukprot:2550567-Rhodomonas_salina.2